MMKEQFVVLLILEHKALSLLCLIVYYVVPVDGAELLKQNHPPNKKKNVKHISIKSAAINQIGNSVFLISPF